MKISSLASRIVVSLVMAVLTGTTVPAAAQFTRVYPDPLNAKIPRRTRIHHKAAVVANASDAVVTD